NGTATATSYDINGALRPLVITVPGAHGGKGAPTGVVYNGTSDFENAPGKPADTSSYRRMARSRAGILTSAPTAVVKATDPTAVYKGIAIANYRGANYLFVVNFKARRIELFDTQFHYVRLRLVYFADGAIPKTYSPFNIGNIGNTLYVT